MTKTPQQPITQSRQRSAQTTSVHLYWCGADPSGPWPAQVASHGGHCPERIYIVAILAGFSIRMCLLFWKSLKMGGDVIKTHCFKFAVRNYFGV